MFFSINIKKNCNHLQRLVVWQEPQQVCDVQLQENSQMVTVCYVLFHNSRVCNEQWRKIIKSYLTELDYNGS